MKSLSQTNSTKGLFHSPVLLGAASLRVVQLTFELLAFPWMLAMLEDWRKHERGSLPGPIELGIITYISSNALKFFFFIAS